MAATKYTYSIQTDFPNHVENSDSLTTEIEVSSITVALDHIDTAGDDCDIWFKAALAEGEETALDGVVAAHQGVAPEPPISEVKLASPETSDGKPIFLPCLFPGGVYLYLSGSGDGETERGAGDLFIVSSATEGDTTVDMDPYLDYIYLAGGHLLFSGAELGDYFSARMVCPASVAVENLTNTGNCNLMDCPPCPGVPAGSKLFIPAAGDGTHDVDLALATPVPTHDPEEGGIGGGFYNWIESAGGYGRGTIVPAPSMNGDYHLLDHEIQLINFVNKALILGSGIISLSIPAVKPKKILPHWHGRMLLHNTGTHALKAALTVLSARTVTL